VRVDLTRTVGLTTALELTVSHVRVFTPLALMTQPAMVWSLAFATGGAARSYEEYNAPLERSGAAVLVDATPWTFADQGDLWSLFYPSYLDVLVFRTRGVGGTVALLGDVLDNDGYPWSQIGTTTVDGGITFRVTLPYLWQSDISAFQIAGLEAVSLTDFQGQKLLAGSCGVASPCGSVPQTTVPEPSTAVLVTLGLLSLAQVKRRCALRREPAPDSELT